MWRGQSSPRSFPVNCDLRDSRCIVVFPQVFSSAAMQRFIRVWPFAGRSARATNALIASPSLLWYSHFVATLQHKVPAGLDRKEAEVYRHLDPARLPRHIAIIMDGNGRWAKRRHLPRVAGHRAGVTAVRSTVETAARIGIHALTLYAFSEENWK